MIPKKLVNPTINLDSLYEVNKLARKSFAEKTEPTLGKIYITATDFGILKLVYEFRILNPENEWALVLKTEMQYAKYNEKYHLKFIADVNAQRNNAGEKYNMKYLQVNTVENNKNVSKSYSNNFHKIDRWDDLWNIAYEYHPLFWNNANNGFVPNFDISKLITTTNAAR